MKSFKLTLTNDDGVVLEQWTVGIGECEILDVEDMTSEAKHSFYTDDNHSGDFGAEVWTTIEKAALKERVKVTINGDTWTLNRIDGHHLSYELTSRTANVSPPVAHVAELKDWAGDSLYDELIKWLNGQPNTLENVRWTK